MDGQVTRWLFEGSARWSAETSYKYRRALADLLGWLMQAGVQSLSEVGEDHLIAWISSHRTWGPNQKHVAVYACRGFFGWALGDASPAARLHSPRRKNSTPPQRRLNEPQALQLIESLDTSTPKGIRDLAIVLLMIDRGLRASEVCRIRLENLNPEARELSVIVKGKRWSRRTFGDYAWSALSRWLEIRPRFAKPGVETVFVSLGGATPGRHMTRCGLLIAFRVMAKRAGLGPFSPHDLRRTFVGLSMFYGNSSQVTQRGGDWMQLGELDTYARGLVIDDWRPYSPVDRLMGLRS